MVAGGLTPFWGQRGAPKGLQEGSTVMKSACRAHERGWKHSMETRSPLLKSALLSGPSVLEFLSACNVLEWFYMNGFNFFFKLVFLSSVLRAEGGRKNNYLGENSQIVLNTTKN